MKDQVLWSQSWRIRQEMENGKFLDPRFIVGGTRAATAGLVPKVLFSRTELLLRV